MKKMFDNDIPNLVTNKKVNDIWFSRNFPSSIRNWNNSVYAFNLKNISLISDSNKLSTKLIKYYFNAVNFFLEKKIRKYRLHLRFKRLSSNKIYVSNGTFKHTNDRVIITLYVYNRQKVNYVYLINKKFRRFLLKRLLNKLIYIRYKVSNFIKKEQINRLIVSDILHNYDYENQKNKKYTKDYEKIYKKLIKRILKKYKIYFLYKQLLYINKSKFNYNYLTYLSYLLKKIYKKNIHFDIVNLKFFYLNSDIFTQAILLKIKRNRKNIVKKLKNLIIKTNTTLISKYITYKPLNKNTIKNKNYTNHLILNDLYKNKLSVKKTILSLIKYKKVTGVRIEAHGRLTKRYTASKSIYKYKYKGNLINYDSSYLGLPSVLLRGNLRSNLQYTNIRSNTRIGSYGLKGWVSSY